MDSDEQPDASEPPCSAELCPALLSVEQHTAEPRSAVQPPPTVDRVVEPSAEHPAAVKHSLVLHCTASVEHAMVRPRSVEPPPNEAILQIEGHARQAREMQSNIAATPAKTPWKRTLIALLIVLNGLCM